MTSCLEVCGHGAFSPLKLETAFGDLVQCVETGARPAGDDVLNPTAAAAPDFGCTVADKAALRPWDNPTLAFLKRADCPPVT